MKAENRFKTLLLTRYKTSLKVSFSEFEAGLLAGDSLI